MKLRIQKNLLKNTWSKAVTYRQWALDEIEKGSDQDAIEHWSAQFQLQIDLLATITTESYCTLYDMATIEAQDRSKTQSEAARIAEELKAEIEAAA